jgi:hypothetical protein
MLFDILIVFVIITIILFFLSVFLLEDYPMQDIPFIMMGMVFSIFCTYGFWKVEYFYVGYNATVGNSSYYTSNLDYGDPYSYIFVLVFFIFTILFVKAGFNMWRESLKQKGEMEYSKMRVKK